jgi:threonine synthase
VTLATAHAAKFVEVVRDAVGVTPDIPERLARLLTLPKVSVHVEPELDALRTVLLERYST